MNSVEASSARHLPTVSRAVLSLAIGVAHTLDRAIGGHARTRAAQANAHAAVQADQDRARQREEIRRMVAALTAPTPTAPARPAPGRSAPGRSAVDQPAVGSSPRSRASHASLVR